MKLSTVEEESGLAYQTVGHYCKSLGKPTNERLVKFSDGGGEVKVNDSNAFEEYCKLYGIDTNTIREKDLR